jgi:hypothetical protein
MTLFFAVTVDTFSEVFTDLFGEMIRREEELNFIIFDPTKKEIVQWLRAKS